MSKNRPDAERHLRYVHKIPSSEPLPPNLQRQLNVRFPGTTPIPDPPPPQPDVELPPVQKPTSAAARRERKRRVPAWKLAEDQQAATAAVRASVRRRAEAAAAGDDGGLPDLARLLAGKPGAATGLAVIGDALGGVARHAGVGDRLSTTTGTAVNWASIGVDFPEALPDDHRAAIELLAPPPPRRWRSTAYPKQLAVADSKATTVMLLAGRGFGKTFTCSNALVEEAVANRGDYAAIGPTLGDAVKIMTESDSGLLTALGPDLDRFDRSKLILYLRNGSRIVLASAERPDRLRGWNLHAAWVDELGSFGARADALWYEALQPALRGGANPRVFISTTPRRGVKVLRSLVADGVNEDNHDVEILHGRTEENSANLSRGFAARMRRQYKGTTLGRQELDGELLADVDGALVNTFLLDSTRVTAAQVPVLYRLVVAVDPAVTSGKTSDDTGITVQGVGAEPVGKPGIVEGPHLYLLASTAIRATPERAMLTVLDTVAYWAADAIVVETNNGGDYLTTTLRMVAAAHGRPLPRIIKVNASQGKRTRAEPVSALWEQGRAHVVGSLPSLEDQWSTWTPEQASPDELDASVWGAADLIPEVSSKPRNKVRIIAS